MGGFCCAVVNEGGESFGCAWGDYDNDGFLDLVVGNGGASLTSPPSSVNSHNFLYHNNGNTNAWLGVKLVGSRSNRAGIGAKVRLKAFYAGAWRWQLRELWRRGVRRPERPARELRAWRRDEH